MKPGELGAGGRVRTVGVALRQQLSMLAGTVLGPRRGASNMAWSIVDAPDSRLCRDALDEARECLSAPVFRHSLRCWQYASAFAVVDDLRPDQEALYVSCLLHDLALGSELDSVVGCFALLGAERAGRFVHEHGGDQRTSRIVHEAVARHMDVSTPDAAEASLLHDAAYLDVSGRRIRDLERQCLVAVESCYPRAGFATEFASKVEAESRLRPKSRAAVFWRSGMQLALRANPLERGLTSSRSRVPAR
ncbi:HD domain-containing protein [Rhodococcus sp. 077-4]|uniref:HD domain-containing protein n=1 Tax=Rhodococcus sp. 077-4 TaxID=2789271 RepID=UPI0039F5A155